MKNDAEKIIEEIQKGFVEVHKLSIKTNNSLQDIRQDIILLKEENKREHEEMRKEHKELKQLILSGDNGSAELIVDEETKREMLVGRIAILEKDVRKIKQKIFA